MSAVDTSSRGSCALCADLEVVRYDGGRLPRSAPHCSACHRTLQAVEIEGVDRRRLAVVRAAGVQPTARQP